MSNDPNLYLARVGRIPLGTGSNGPESGGSECC